MLCQKCKKEIPDGSVYCLFCGKKQSGTSTTKKKGKRRKRGNGTGSVYKEAGSRKKPWVAVITLGYDETGKRQSEKLGYYATEKEAVNALESLPQNMIKDNINITLRQLYDLWAPKYYRHLSDKGIEGYKSCWNKWVCPNPNSVKPVRSLSAFDFDSFVQAIVDDGKGIDVCKRTKRLLRYLCRLAVKMNVISTNTAELIDIEKIVKFKNEKDIFTAEELEVLWQHSGDRNVQYILFMVYSGFRISGFLSLDIRNINMEENYMIGGIKTDAGRDRIVPIHPLIKNILSGFMDEAKARAEKLPGDVPHLLVTNKVGKKYDYRNFTERIFLPTLVELHIIPEYRKGKLDENGIKIEERQKPRLTPHCTRHTFASLMDSAGMNKNILARIIGHTDPKTTNKYYIHKQSKELVQAMMDAAKSESNRESNA